jgi:hypothetical protein
MTALLMVIVVGVLMLAVGVDLAFVVAWRGGDGGEKHRGRFPKRNVICGARGAPPRRAWAGRTPSISARFRSSSLHTPIPVSRSGVMLEPFTTKAGSSHVCDPPEKRFSMTKAPPGPLGVWQPSQAMTALTR